MDAAQQEATARARELQRNWYGEPLGALFRRLIDDLGLNQARLAAVLGLSAPMLSQLMSGQRAKIGNPAVVQRVQLLQELAGQVADGSVSAAEATDRMDEIKKSQGGSVLSNTSQTTTQFGGAHGQAGRPRDPVAAALGGRRRATSSMRRTPSPRPTRNWQSSSGCTAPAARRTRSPTTSPTRTEPQARSPKGVRRPGRAGREGSRPRGGA